MQEAGKATEATPHVTRSSSPVPPVRAFVAISLVVALTVLGLWFTRSGEGASSGGSKGESGLARDSNSQMMDLAEGVRIWRELSALSGKAIEDRDLSLLGEIYIPNSPGARQARSSIKQLLRDDVIEKTEVITKDVEILSLSANEIQVSEKRVLRPCFVTERGRDITKGPAAIEQLGVWVIRLEDDQWRIFRGILKDDRVIDRKQASCA